MGNTDKSAKIGYKKPTLKLRKTKIPSILKDIKIPTSKSLSY